MLSVGDGIAVSSISFSLMALILGLTYLMTTYFSRRYELNAKMAILQTPPPQEESKKFGFTG